MTTTMLALGAAAGGAIALLLGMLRLFAGPTHYDRALALNGALMRLALICAAAAVIGRPTWIDAAFALLLGGFVANVALLKFFRAGSFQAALAHEGE